LVLMVVALLVVVAIADRSVRETEGVWARIQADGWGQHGALVIPEDDVTALSGGLERTGDLIGLILGALVVLGAGASLVTKDTWHRIFGVRADVGSPDPDGDVDTNADVNALYRDVVERGLQGILIHEDFRPLFVNPAFVRLFGFGGAEEALACGTMLTLVDESARDDMGLIHRKVATGEVPEWLGRLPCRTVDGTPVWVEEMVRPVEWCGRQAVLVTFLDITDRVTHENEWDMERAQTERQAEAVVALAEELNAALKLAEEQKAQLHRLSISDPLTGAFNRRHFMEQVGAETVRMARQSNYRVSLLIMDIDHFKAINDTYGHAVGDEALRLFTRQCRDVLRENDVFGRMGGEEFAVLLPNTDVDEATVVAERLLDRTRAICVSATDDRVFGFTVSIGVAAIRDPRAPFDEALLRADTALYASKAGGRDRVTVDTQGPGHLNDRSSPRALVSSDVGKRRDT